MQTGPKVINDDEPIYPVPDAFARQANLTPETFKKMYDRSISDPEGFWSEHGQRIDWMTPYTKAKMCLGTRVILRLNGMQTAF